MDKKNIKFAQGTKEDKPTTGTAKTALEKETITNPEVISLPENFVKPSPGDVKQVIVLERKSASQEMPQREAVYIEVMRLIREEKISVGEKQPVKPLLNETHIKKICVALVGGFQAKKIALKDTESNRQKLADAKVMELYCLGLLNNWLRRDKRLNGVGENKNK